MFALMSLLRQSQKYRRNGMIHDAGSSLWPRSSPSWKDHGKDIEASGVSEKAAVVSEASEKAKEASGDSGEEIEASEEDQEVETKATDPKTKARSGVLVKPLVSDRSRGFVWQKQDCGTMELSGIFHIKLKARFL